jgi:uncharacterized membrane protein YhhN
MGAGVYAAKLSFMAEWPAQLRLTAMVGIGVVLYLVLLLIFDRKLIFEVIDFGLQVVRRKTAAQSEAS